MHFLMVFCSLLVKVQKCNSGADSLRLTKKMQFSEESVLQNDLHILCLILSQVLHLLTGNLPHQYLSN